MADEPNPNSTNENTPDPSSSGAPSGTPPSTNNWKAPAHSQFAGRSAEEVLGIAEMALARLNTPAAPAPAPEPKNRFDFDLPDDEYLNGAQVKRLLTQIASQPAPVDWVSRQQAAGALLAMVQLRRADDFKRWGPEIGSEIQKMSPEYWTVDNLNIIVDIVKSRHVDELARETAERLISEGHPTIRSGSGGSGAGPSTTQSNMQTEGLPSDWVERLRAKGITEATVREFCAETGQTVAQYYADAMKWGKAAIVNG